MSSNVTKALWKTNIYKKREFSIAYMGGLGITSKLSKELRIILQAECEKNEACLFVNLDSHTSQANIFNHGYKYGPYAKATFCLMPGGGKTILFDIS